MAKKQKRGIMPRVFITLIGCLLIITGVGRLVLGIVGVDDTAVITSVRREGGERDEMTRGRYTYIIGYSFKLPDGTSVDGFSRHIGDSVYLKVGKENSIVPIKYFNSFPYINAMEEEIKPGIGQLVLILAGAYLVYVMNRNKSGAS